MKKIDFKGKIKPLSLEEQEANESEFPPQKCLNNPPSEPYHVNAEFPIPSELSVLNSFDIGLLKTKKEDWIKLHIDAHVETCAKLEQKILQRIITAGINSDDAKILENKRKNSQKTLSPLCKLIHYKKFKSHPFQIPLDSTGSFSTLIFFFLPPLAP